VSTNLLIIRGHLEDLPRATSPVQITELVDRVQRYLIELSTRLENDGFAEDQETRYFIRSIGDLGRQVRHQVRGGIYQGLGGGGSGSDGP
jgi:hypothetical protein